MTDIKKFRDLLLEVPEITSAEHVKSVPSAITTNWSEEIWTEDMISRDTLQNFYDGCAENKLPISEIKISTDNDTVRIYAPNEFNLEKLYYIGSTKSESETPMIGAHGEGGKKVFSDLFPGAGYPSPGGNNIPPTNIAQFPTFKTLTKTSSWFWSND